MKTYEKKIFRQKRKNLFFFFWIRLKRLGIHRLIMEEWKIRFLKAIHAWTVFRPYVVHYHPVFSIFVLLFLLKTILIDEHHPVTLLMMMNTYVKDHRWINVQINFVGFFFWLFRDLPIPITTLNIVQQIITSNLSDVLRFLKQNVDFLLLLVHFSFSFSFVS